MRQAILIAALIGLLAACGDEKGQPAGQGSPASQKGAGESERTRSMLASSALSEWEWHWEDVGRFEEFRGRVVGPDGKPVPGTTVSAAIMSMMLAHPPKILSTQTVGEDGIFTFRDIPDNTWVLAEHPAYAGALLPLGPLEEGESGLPEVRLRKPATVTGTVRLEDGTPVPDCPVNAITFAPNWAAFVRTDAEGRYSIDTAPPETIRIGVGPGEFMGKGVRIQPTPGDSVVQDLVVRKAPGVSGQVLDENGKPIPGALVLAMMGTARRFWTDEEGRFRIEGASQPVLMIRAEGYGETIVGANPDRKEHQEMEPIRLSPGATVRGRLLDSAGAPVANARLQAYIEPETQVKLSFGPLTDEDGRFDFSWISVKKTPETVYLVAHSQHSLPSPGKPIELKQGDVVEDVELRLVRPSTLRFRVVGEDGNPLRVDQVILDRRIKGAERNLRERLMAGAMGQILPDGHVRVSNLDAADYSVRILIPGRIPFKKFVKVEAEKVRDLGDLVVPAGLSVSGRVKVQAGKIPADAVIEVTHLQQSFLEKVRPDEEGRFELGGLVEGTVTLRAMARGYETVILRVPAGTEDLEIPFRRNARLSLSFQRPEGVEGRIHFFISRFSNQKETGQGMERWLPEGENTFEESNLAPGTWKIKAELADSYLIDEFEAPEGETVEREFGFESGGAVAGRVLDADGKTVSGVSVSLEGPPEWGRREATSDGVGHFEFHAVPPGPATLRAHPRGHPPFEVRVTVAAGEETEQDVSLSAGGGIKVVVKDSEGRPVARARVLLRDEAGESVRFDLGSGAEARTDPKGELLLTGIKPGAYDLSVLLGGEVMEIRSVEVKEGELSEAKIVIER